MPDEELNLLTPEPEEDKDVAEAGEKPDKTPDQVTPTDETVKEDEQSEETGEAEEAEDAGGEQKPTERTYPKGTVDKLIENRLQRDRRVREQEFSRVAGVRMDHEEVKKAATLWGFLTRNPEINAKLGQLIQEATSSGNVRHAPQEDLTSEREKELALKEAILDLKSKDRIFRQHSADILEWADLNGYEIDDPRTLRLAVMAWKGENMHQIVGNAQKKAEEQAAVRTQQKKDAGLLPGKGVRSSAKIDYKKMSAEEILRAEGLSLFTKDEP